MTRKQAILQAIDILSSDNANNDIVLKLKEIESELPLSHWTKESIIDSILTYAEEHDNILPRTEELTTSNNLPSITVIEKRFNVTSINDFYKLYFPEYMKKYNRCRAHSPYAHKHDTYFINSFISNRANIQKTIGCNSISAKTYDKYRAIGSPTLKTIIENCNCKNHEELLILCGYKKKQNPMMSSINITVLDSENKNEELKSIILQLKEDIEKQKT